MREIVTIDGKEVKLVSHGGTPFIYKQEFGSDFFADLMVLIKSLDATDNIDGFDLSKVTYEQLDHIDLGVLYQLIYVFAKCGNKELPGMLEWLESFDEFPVFDLMEPINNVIGSLLKRSKK